MKKFKYSLILLIIVFLSYFGKITGNNINSYEGSVTIILDSSSVEYNSSTCDDTNGLIDLGDNINVPNQQPDSINRGSTVTLSQKLNIKSNLEIKNSKENVTYKDLYPLLDERDSSMEEIIGGYIEYSITPIIEEGIKTKQINEEIEAKAYLFWIYLEILSLILTIFFRIMHWNNKGDDDLSPYKFWASLFGIILIGCLFMMGLEFNNFLMLIKYGVN